MNLVQERCDKLAFVRTMLHIAQQTSTVRCPHFVKVHILSFYRFTFFRSVTDSVQKDISNESTQYANQNL